MRKRTPHNIEVYNIATNILNKVDYYEMMWENCDTDLCAFAQLLSNNDESDICIPLEVVTRRYYGYTCCSLYCPCWAETGCAFRRYLA